MGTVKGMTLPPEIVAAQRQRRRRMLRLYAAGIGAVALLCLVILVVFGGIFGAQVSTDTRFVTDFNAASSALARDDFSTAAREMRAAIAIRDGYETQYDLGVILLKAGRYADDLTTWRTAATLKHGSDPYWYGAIDALAMRRPALARDLAQQAVTLDPLEGYYHAALAMAWQRLGQRARANKEFATARGYDYTGQTIQQWIAQAQFVPYKPVSSGD